MAEITVHYFDIYARGEAIRLILHYAGAQFTDHRIQFQEWPALKTSGIAEFGQLPVVEVDGHRLVQSNSITRYLCHKYHYDVSSHEEEYYVESLCDLFNDIIDVLGKLIFSKDTEGLAKAFQERVPQWLSLIEARLSRNHEGNGFFVGDHPTRVDFHAFALIHDHVHKGHPELLDAHAPKVKQWLTRFVESSQTLKSYLETRPARDF